MKFYITARFKGDENKSTIESLCAAVKEAGHQDFCFVRDVEHYQKIFSNPRDLWERTKIELQKCEALLIDVSDQPTGGRVVEAGMAFAWDMPIYVIAAHNTTYKDLYTGIATTILHYDTLENITAQLQQIK